MQQTRLTEIQAINLLKKYKSSDRDYNIVLKHSKKVQEIALRFAKKKKCDIEFITGASLLHDIGRFRCHRKNVERHGIEGANILRKEGLEDYARVCERHLGAGISKKEVIEQGLNLPHKDFIPLTIEEKIIAGADNLVFNDREGTIEEVYKRFLHEIGKKAADKAKKLHEEIIS